MITCVIGLDWMRCNEEWRDVWKFIIFGLGVVLICLLTYFTSAGSSFAKSGGGGGVLQGMDARVVCERVILQPSVFSMVGDVAYTICRACWVALLIIYWWKTARYPHFFHYCVLFFKRYVVAQSELRQTNASQYLSSVGDMDGAELFFFGGRIASYNTLREQNARIFRNVNLAWTFWLEILEHILARKVASFYMNAAHISFGFEKTFVNANVV